MQHAAAVTAAVTAAAAFTAAATAAVTGAAVLESRAARLPAALYNNNNTTSASLENEREQGAIPTLERFCISFPSRAPPLLLLPPPPPLLLLLHSLMSL